MLVDMLHFVFAGMCDQWAHLAVCVCATPATPAAAASLTGYRVSPLPFSAGGLGFRLASHAAPGAAPPPVRGFCTKVDPLVVWYPTSSPYVVTAVAGRCVAFRGPELEGGRIPERRTEGSADWARGALREV
jgi:hypothetical protein